MATLTFGCVALAAGLLAASASAQSERAQVRIAGAQRARYESLAPQFRSGFDNRDQALALRTNVLADASFGRFGVAGEVMDSRLELNDRSSPNTLSVNALEPLQAYGHLAVGGDRGNGVLRVGRMTLDLSKRRLVARNAFRNTSNSFVGADWQWRGANGLLAQAFHFQPMRTLPNGAEEILANEPELDRAARDSRLYGGLVRRALGGAGGEIEGYAMSFVADAAGIDLDTFGLRAFRDAEPGEWLYEVEGVLQRGRSAGADGPRSTLDHRASYVHVELGYVFGTRRAPSLRLTHAAASGDRDPFDGRNERFNTLFGARRFDYGPTGIFGPFARANLETTGVRFTLDATPRSLVMLDYRAAGLASVTDVWFATGLRDPSGRSGRALGRQLEASVIWEAIPERLTVETGFARFSKGRFAKQAPNANGLGDPLYFHATLTTSFGR